MTPIVARNDARSDATESRLRVAIFLSSLGHIRGGLETIAARCAQGLAQHGHAVTCVSGAWPGRSLPSELQELPVGWLRVPFLPPDLPLWPGSSPRSRARRLKFQSLSFSAACRCHPGVRRLLAAAEVTLSVLEIETVYLSRWRTALGRPHVSYFPGIIDRAWIRRDRSTLRLAISHTLAGMTPDLRVDGVVPPGIDESWLEQRYEIRREANTLFFTGRLEANKGAWELLHIFQTLAHDRSELRLRLAGDGPLRGQLQAWVAQTGLAERITFLGAIPAARVRTELSAADLFLFPTHYESFGLAVVEAQAVGVPVACSNLPVMQEASGGAACFLPPRESGRWAPELRALLDDVEARTRLSRAGRRNARRYTWARSVDSLERYLLMACKQQ